MRRGAVAAFIAVLILSFSFSISFGQEEGEQYKEFPQKENVPSNKSWTVEFTRPVYFHGINDSDVYVKDKNGNVVAGTKVHYEHSRPYVLVLRPPQEGWQIGVEYTLFTSSEIVSQEGEKLEKAAKMSFEAGHESGEITLAIERSGSLPYFYRALVQTSSKSAKYYAVFSGEEMLTQVTPIGEKSIFVIKDEDNAVFITVKTLSTSSELDVVESNDFPIGAE
ncbi:hypothetical protein SAMN02745945_02795 [Peptoclostridium litorale DSM 5388]|uniref:SbsA Ig-like domain-containing protein n=1 Tax=Peptoclostridium litorale DSM 5388 TaxID=1121324 RepID=A0A069RFJ2_PEPLI|nr:hypothetical protein [Peptoclostridium litorale]KDR94965.1 hypothetical protein CLIT_12c00330 [Peptoclostridium litorale DSM 5388]SIO33715.1 hypothetical protein SAMN02745945_02795 [Peptoclostridium litorale DSM 5388]